MSGKFIGEVCTIWLKDGEWMQLNCPFTYIDRQGKDWTAPKDAYANGASIPKQLWSVVGAPFRGKYRRASVLHDFFVGENPNKPRTFWERRSADKMFYYACLDDGCTAAQARILYLGVSIGTYTSPFRKAATLTLDKGISSKNIQEVLDSTPYTNEDDFITQKMSIFNAYLASHPNCSIEELESLTDAELFAHTPADVLSKLHAI